MLTTLRSWDRRRWSTAAVGTLATGAILGLPTDVIPNPVFGRPVPVTWWSYPVLAVSALLGGLLLATYVRDTAVAPEPDRGAVDERPARVGGAGGLISFFAIGCPVCNKVVVLALGTVGARQWFEPVQPLLAVVSIALMAVALRARLRSALSCPLPSYS